MNEINAPASMPDVMNVEGIEGILREYIKAGKINEAKGLFQNRDEAVLDAIKEYNPEQHAVMNRLNKERKGGDPYITEKLPIAWQRYINDVSVFFMFAKPVIWREVNATNETEEAFKAFEKFLKDTKFHTGIRQAKRLAGAETESAKIYHVYKGKDGLPKVKPIIIAKSSGYKLRPLFNQYGDMPAFAYGYFLKEGNKTVEHFDIMLPDVIYNCRKENTGWEIESIVNPIGKIPAIYYRQPKEWDGVQPRIERDEMLDSKQGDTNNYFADPIAKITSGAISSIPNPEQVGKIVQLRSKEDVFEYVEPPTATEMRDSEKKTLRDTILLNSFTPDFSYEQMKGTGTLSGEAMNRALIVGYIKRDNRMEIYDELLEREKNLILAIMRNVTHIPLASKIDKLEIEHQLAEPFDEDTKTRWGAIGKAYTDNVMSLETAVDQLGVANPVDEVKKIRSAQQVNDEMNLFPGVTIPKDEE